MKGNDWNLEITAPPELHKPIQELFDAMTWQMRQNQSNGSICTKTWLNDEDRTTGDTINRQAAIRWVKTECNPYGKPTLDFESGKKVIEHLEQMPPAQPQRKSGQLLYHHTENIDEVKTADVYFCSFCKKEVLKKIRFGMFKGELDIKYGYCPHCGADMRGEIDE